MNTIQKQWKDVVVGDIFPDGSRVVSIHESYEENCFTLFYLNDETLQKIVLSQRW